MRMSSGTDVTADHTKLVETLCYRNGLPNLRPNSDVRVGETFDTRDIRANAKHLEASPAAEDWPPGRLTIEGASLPERSMVSKYNGHVYDDGQLPTVALMEQGDLSGPSYHGCGVRRMI